MARGGIGLALVAGSLACSGPGNGSTATTAATFADASAGDDDDDDTGDDDDDDDGGDDDDDDDDTGDDDDDDDDDTADGSTGEPPIEPPDFSDGTWEFENISMTPGISLHAHRTLLDDGTEFVAWAQAHPRQLSQLNIMTALGPMDWPVSTVTTYEDVQNTYPSLAGGNRALLAWSGRTSQADETDIWLVRSDGGAWGAPENISDGLEDPELPLTDTEPVIMRRDDGGVAVVYLATDPDPLTPNVPDVFVSKFFEDNAPATRIALNPSGANCSALAGATAPSGVFHVVLLCFDSGDSILMHATDRSGDWDIDELNGSTSGMLTPDMSAGPQGVHFAWVQDVPCGDAECDEVFYMATDAEEVFATPVQVTDTANLDERSPAVGADPWGRVLVISQARVDNVARLYLSVSTDGEAFSDTERISPDSVDDYQVANDVAFDEVGNPSFVLQVAIDGSDPLNLEIYRAQFVPN